MLASKVKNCCMCCCGQFLQRQRVLGMYRDLLRSIRKVPNDSDRRYLRDWAREEFKRNKSETDQVNPSLHFPSFPRVCDCLVRMRPFKLLL